MKTGLNYSRTAIFLKSLLDDVLVDSRFTYTTRNEISKHLNRLIEIFSFYPDNKKPEQKKEAFLK